MPASKRQPHIELQGRYFNQRADMFLRPIPQSIQERTREIVKMAGVSARSKVLDVGSGVGVLIGHFLEMGVEEKNIVGCDLSEEMIARARARFPGVFFWQGDIVDLPSPLPEQFPGHFKFFDRVFFNACFGNMWDQRLTLEASFRFLGIGGQVILSHPLGAPFVEVLKQSDPDIVPHSLPDIKSLETWAPEIGYTVHQFVDRSDFYFVGLEKAYK